MRSFIVLHAIITDMYRGLLLAPHLICSAPLQVKIFQNISRKIQRKFWWIPGSSIDKTCLVSNDFPRIQTFLYTQSDFINYCSTWKSIASNLNIVLSSTNDICLSANNVLNYLATNNGSLTTDSVKVNLFFFCAKGLFINVSKLFLCRNSWRSKILRIEIKFPRSLFSALSYRKICSCLP